MLWFMSKSKFLNFYLLQINFSHFITNEKLCCCCCCYCLDLQSYPNKKYKLFIWTNLSVKSQSHDSIFSEPKIFFLQQFFFQFVKSFTIQIASTIYLSRFFLSNHTVHKTRFAVFDELNFISKLVFLIFLVK